MQLKDFISETLKQIIDGVSDAQNHASENGAKINPSDLTLLKTGSSATYSDPSQKQFAQIVSFDVALTTTEGDSSKGGLGIFVGPVGIGAESKSDSTNSTVNRISFNVPVFLPTQNS